MRCEPRSQVQDGYGNSFDRSGACKAGSASVVVRTVDNCELTGGLGGLAGWLAGLCGLGLAGFQRLCTSVLLCHQALDSKQTSPCPPSSHAPGPCTYPANAYSNKRWCCNDHSSSQGTHFDMSLW